jgi:Tol biopolymer transport system component
MTLGQHSKASQIVFSTFLDSAADFAPDGSRVAFCSDRSGSNEIWICNVDGSEPRRVTNFGGPMTGSPRWSPDGRWLAFDSRAVGRAEIYLIEVAGGSPNRITNGGLTDSDNVVPNWSHDGKSLYFSSNRTGEWQVWRKNIATGGETQVTIDGGFNAVESHDGREIYYVHDVAKTSIWRVPTAGGKPTRIIDELGPGMWGYWAIDRGSLFYLTRISAGNLPSDIFRHDLTTGTTEKLGKTQYEINPSDKGLAVAPDGRSLLYTQTDVDRSGIMLIDEWDR